MDRSRLISTINAEIEKLQSAVRLLGEGSTVVRGPNGRIRSRVLSPAARKRISEAQRARWAKKKAANVAAERTASSKFKSKAK